MVDHGTFPERDEPRTTFRGRRLPVAAYLAGYSALFERYDLPVPLHDSMTAVSAKNLNRRENGWLILPASVRPGPSLVEHLVFALKREGVQPLALKKIFERADPSELVLTARSKPTSGYIRRLCHLYEWLLGKTLDLPDTKAGAYVDLVDQKLQYGSRDPSAGARFRINHNLPGRPSFCPVVFRTHRLDDFIASNLAQRAKDIVASAPKELIARAAAFLLLSDSKASFAIEGEDPPKERLARWGAAIARAGQMKLDTPSLIDLQRELVGDARFVKIGLRLEGGFVGRHDALGQPVPELISAKAEDLAALLHGIASFASLASLTNFHPVLTAACVAFGFVYVHPFEDGNGRIHRLLIHHVLAERGFTPPGIVFPISSVILEEIVHYKGVLESISAPMQEWVDWAPTDKGNVRVLNDTADYYRYFDATAHCEFLFDCITTTVEKALPEELGFLERRDQFHRQATEIVDMSERVIDLLLSFLRQGQGRLSKRALDKEFSMLREDERARIERIYVSLFMAGPSVTA